MILLLRESIPLSLGADMLKIVAVAVVIGVIIGLCLVQIHFRVTHLSRGADDNEDTRAFRSRIRDGS